MEEEKSASKLSKKSAPFKAEQKKMRWDSSDENFDEEIAKFKSEMLKLESTQGSLDSLIENWEEMSLGS